MIEQGLLLEIPSNQRLEQAVNFYLKAADQDNSEALTDLGSLYEKGIIGEGESGLNLALEYYKRAIELSNPRAMNNFGGMFLAGKDLFYLSNLQSYNC